MTFLSTEATEVAQLDVGLKNHIRRIMFGPKLAMQPSSSSILIDRSKLMRRIMLGSTLHTHPCQSRQPFQEDRLRHLQGANNRHGSNTCGYTI